MVIPPTAWLGFVLVVLIIGIVIIPAVWSKRPARQKAAAEVLDRIIRLLGVGRDERVIEPDSQRRPTGAQGISRGVEA
jgi:hypothetical protein